MSERPRKGRMRSGPTLGKKQVGVGISVGFPLMMVGVALLYSAYIGGGALLGVIGAVLLVLGIFAFTSGKVL